MEHLPMHTHNMADENFRKLAAMFPNAVTETVDPATGEVVRAIDKDVLMQEISTRVVEGREERYQFTWPDKRKAILMANAPITATLRPIRTESVGSDGASGGWDSQNLYIDGDNLEVLKLLQETYLGRIKMIYIDPPYNTGHDFVYEDDFAEDTEDYLARSGQFDEQGNRMEQNTESNGRFHTDWLNMIFPRLKLAKALLSEDGVIFISIDDNELENLRKICDEIFGQENFVGQIIWQRRTSPDMRKRMSTAHDYIVVYARNASLVEQAINKVRLTGQDEANYSNPDNDPRGPWASSDFTAQGYRPNQMYEIVTPGGARYTPPEGRCWKNVESEFLRQCEEGRMWFGRDGMGIPRRKTYLSERDGKNVWTWWPNSEVGHSQEATQEVKALFDGHSYFDFPKPVRLLKKLIQIGTHNESIVLDFFSGSATTAHALMQLNAEDGGHRRFIMVQLPEILSEDSDAYAGGFRTICDIGKERIRRAGKRIKEEAGLTAPDLDIGFRVLRLDSSNMQDVYYNPTEMVQSLLDLTTDNIKPDRTPEDLLFQVMLDLGVELSSAIEEETIDGKKVFIVKPAGVDQAYLIACFDSGVTSETVTAIAKKRPYYAVFRDSSMANDSVATNFDQIFETYSPQTVRKVL